MADDFAARLKKYRQGMEELLRRAEEASREPGIIFLFRRLIPHNEGLPLQIQYRIPRNRG